MFVVLAGQPVKAEMMIVTLTAKGTSFFFHAKRAYSASWKTVKCVGAAQRVKRYRISFPIRKEKSFLLAANVNC
jgi:hypothetical protein